MSVGEWEVSPESKQVRELSLMSGKKGAPG